MPDAHEPPADLPVCPSAHDSGLLPAELRAWMVMLAAVGAVEQRLRGVVKDRLDVSHDEFLVLCLLAEQPREGVRMTRIAELLGRPKTRLTYQIACLQHAGLVTRQSVRGDKRGVEVTLTDEARALLAEASGALAGTVTVALDQVMGPEQREAMRALLPELTADPGACAAAPRGTDHAEPQPPAPDRTREPRATQARDARTGVTQSGVTETGVTRTADLDA